MDNLLARLRNEFVDSIESFLRRFGTAHRTQIITDVRKRLLEGFRNNEDKYLKRFLADKFEIFKSASEEKKDELLLEEITACAQEIMPYHFRDFYNFFATYMGIPFAPFNLRNLVKNLVIEEKETGAIERLKCVSKKACVGYLSDHLCNVDTLIIGYFIREHDLQTPVFIAGKNLFQGGSRFVLPMLNASTLDRERIEAPRRDVTRWEIHGEFMIEWAKRQMDMLAFLTGGRPYDGDQTKKPNVAAGFIKIWMEAVNRGYPVYIVPLSISYTRVPEDKKLYEHAKANDRKGARFSNLWWGWLQTNWAFRDNPVYLTVHMPVSLEEYMAVTDNAEDMAGRVAAHVYGAIKIPTEKLLAVAAALLYNRGAFKSDNGELRIDTGEAIDIVGNLKKYLINDGANLEQRIVKATPAEIVEYGAEKYKRRNALSEKSSIGSLIIPEDEMGVFIVNANHIKHKLPEEMQEELNQNAD